MAFAPSSVISFCNVPFDNTYRNQIYFANRTDQYSYFNSKSVYTFDQYLVIRKTKPDGSMQSSVKVAKNIDDLYKCNYMYYTNANHGTRWFYAFITKLIYINEETTEVVFETDVYQTWLFDVTIKDSFVVREHSATDTIGSNIAPEPFNFDDFTFTHLATPMTNLATGYLITASEAVMSATLRGNVYSGMYQGLYFYYANTYDEVNEILDALEELGSDCILSITSIPDFCLQKNAIGTSEGTIGSNYGQVFKSIEPASETYTLDVSSRAFTFEGYTPKNKKLFTSPFSKIILSNHNERDMEYNIEDFSNYPIMKFNIVGDVSPAPSIKMYPLNYKGISAAFDYGLTLSDFPQCAFNNDIFKLWMNKNMIPSLLNIAASTGTGIVNGLTFGGLGGAITGGVVNLASSTASAIGESYKASKEANIPHWGNTKNNLLEVSGYNRFDLYMRTVKRYHAEQIDDYFTMFGYATNQVKKPNVSSRPYFNYVQTQGVNLVGSIPNDDMTRLKKVYDDGVTLWKPNTTVGDYSVDNSPS